MIHRITSQEVFESFCDLYQRVKTFPFADQSFVPTRNASLYEYFEACGEDTSLETSPELGRRLNAMFLLAHESDTWKPRIWPLKKHSLGELCDFVAEGGKGVEPEQCQWFGKQCEAGAVFLTLREVLCSCGADPDGIGPGSELSPLLKRYWRPLDYHVWKLWPQRVPFIQRKSSWVYILLVAILLLSSVIGVLSLLRERFPLLCFVSIGVGFISVNLSKWAIGLQLRSIAWSDFRNLKELCRAIAKHKPDKEHS